MINFFFHIFINSFAWSIKPIVEKYGILKSSPFYFALSRYITTGIISLIILFFYNYKINKDIIKKIDKKTYLYTILVGFIALIGITSHYYLLEKNNVSIVAAIVEPLIIIITVILSYIILGERITIRQLLGIIITICGMLLILLPN